MAFPHPQSRKNHYRKEDIPSWGSIVWKFFKRTINITEYRNAKDDVNPAKNRTLGDSIHGRLRERGRCIVLRSFSAKPCARVTARTVIKSPRHLQHFELQATTVVVLEVPWRCEFPSLALMDDLERIPVRVKYIGGVVSRISRIVFHSCPR